MEISIWLKNNRKSVIDIIELEDVHSKNDPSDNPYRSQYAARDILQNSITNLEELMITNPNDCNSFTYLVYLNLSYRLANNFISTEERHSGEEIITTIYDKMEQVPYIRQFIQQLEVQRTVGRDVPKAGGSDRIDDSTKREESCNDHDVLWLQNLAGILIKILNTKGMLWASRIINLPEESVTEVEDLGFLNSIKYLNMAKRLYKIYRSKSTKDKDDKMTSQEDTLDYHPPECLDSVLLNHLDYETPYLKYECGSLDSAQKEEVIKLDIFESDYTSTLFLLAQAYGKMSSLNSMKHTSAKYCYKTLSRQLNALKYDPVEWALNAATLSQYYVMEKGFRRARHCIAASQVILKEAVMRPTFGPANGESTKEVSAEDKTKSVEKEVANVTGDDSGVQIDCQQTVDCILEESLDSMIDQLDLRKSSNNLAEKSEDEAQSKTDGDKKRKRLLPDPMSESRFWDDDVYEEKREQAKADICRCWIKYGLTILENSFENLPADYSGKDEELIDGDFPEFNVELDAVEKQVTHRNVETFEDARELFMFVQRQINEARQYYRIDNRCSDAIELICDHSKAFKALSNFENSVERQCCMHKKRIDMLTDVLKILNQNYYQVACRSMMLEVGEIYSTMMSLKMSLIETSNGKMNASIKNAKGAALKIKRLAVSGINMYQTFLDSYRNREGVAPEVYSEDDIRPVMVAHFYMARMFSKILEPDLTERVSNFRKSLAHYQFIVDYCDKHANAAALMIGELDSCRDMATLLPHKIHKLLN